MTYRPDAVNWPVLGEITSILGSSRPVSATFASNPKFMARLPTGELYFDSNLELDTDGWRGDPEGDPTWQPYTSLRYSDGTSVDANAVPYFVLPLPVSWPRQFGISLGDYGAMIFNGRVAFGVFADFGNNPGEGSIELLRRLGTNRLRRNGTVKNAGIEGGVISIVFPGSGDGTRMPDEATLKAGIEVVARERFQNLGGVVNPPEALLTSAGPASLSVELSLAQKIVNAASKEESDFGRYTEGVSPLRERIGTYWKAVGENYDGSNHTAYWSAVFISFMVREAGGASAFYCCDQHSKYVHRAIADRVAERQDRFWAFRPTEVSVAPGDILAMNRGDGRPLSYDEAARSDDYGSHADIVVSVEGGTPQTIGGNVGTSPGTVGSKDFHWSGGLLVNSNNPRQQVYAVLRPPAI